MCCKFQRATDTVHTQNPDWLTVLYIFVAFGWSKRPPGGTNRVQVIRPVMAMASVAKDNVSYRLLNKLSSLVICSRCLREGVVTPVPQLISVRHELANECLECRSKKSGRSGHRRRRGKLLTLPN
jgi:hypothetical protein